MSELASQRCEPCEGGVEPLTRDEIDEYLEQIHSEWVLNDGASEIFRDFEFKGFYRTMAFVNAIAWIANAENHHPDLEVGYRHCLVRYTTHAIGGLSPNDFICAAKTDELLP